LKPKEELTAKEETKTVPSKVTDVAGQIALAVIDEHSTPTLSDDGAKSKLVEFNSEISDGSS